MALFTRAEMVHFAAVKIQAALRGFQCRQWWRSLAKEEVRVFVSFDRDPSLIVTLPWY